MAAKRKREKKFQIWLDPENDTEARALETVDYFMNEYGKTRKEVFLWALEVLRVSEWRNDFVPEDAQIAEIRHNLNLLVEQIRNGTLPGLSGQSNVAEHKEVRKRLGEIEESISSRYRELDFDDE